MKNLKFLNPGRIDSPIWIILIIGAMILSLKCVIVYPVSHIGHNDAIGYAEMADSIIHGRGLQVDYVSFHFIKYPEIRRPEDHWPPLYSFLIVPFYLIFGKIAIAFKLPSIIISSIFLPIATYSLGRKLSSNKWIGLIAALTVMLYPRLFFWSLFCLSDVTYTFVFLLVILFAIKGHDGKRYFYLMGVTIGIAYYAKGTALLLIPAVVLFYMVKTWSLKALFYDRKFLISIGLAFLVILPFLVRNYIHYRDPMHSTQNYWSGNIGYSIDGPSNGNTYKVYWDITKPSWVDTKLPLGIRHIAKKSWEYFDTQFQWAFINMGRNEPLNIKSILFFRPIRNFFKDFPSYPGGIPVGILGIPALLGLFFMWRNRDIYIIPIAFGILLFFLSVLWAPIERLILVSVPLVVALGWTSYYRFLRWAFHRLPAYRSRIVIAIISLLAIANFVYAARSDYKSWRNGKSGPQSMFKGAVDQVKVYNKALTEGEILDDFSHRGSSSNDGLISFWTFDDDTVGDNMVEDISGAAAGSIIGDPEVINGKVGEALHFDGNDSVQIPGAESLKLRDAFTVSGWVKGEKSPDSSSGTVTQWLAKPSNYVFSWNHDANFAGSIAFNTESGWVRAQIKEPLSGGKWYHIAGTWDGEFLKIYLNGSLSSKTQVIGKPIVSDAPLMIGGRAGGGWFPYSNGVFEREQLLAAKWIRENTAPDSVIMDCDPWALQFYSDRKCVHFACDTPAQIFRVMRHYGVTHITYDTYEAAHPKTLDDFYSGKALGFELVYSISSRLKIYKVNYDVLPAPTH